MTDAQIYCTLNEVIDDLGLQGNEPRLYNRIEAASRYISQKVGQFLPIWEARTIYADTRLDSCYTDPILTVDGVTNNAVDVDSDDYDLNPAGMYWRNGPYTRLYSDVVAWDEVVISGSWGLYNYSESTGINGTQTTTSETTITVSNGAKLSAGMVLKLGSEFELVTSTGSGTLCTSLLNETLTAADEEITIDNGSEINVGEVILIGTEDIYVRAVRSNTLVTSRGWNGTTKASHADDSSIYVYRTYNVTRAVNGTTAATHANVEIYQVKPPDDINYLCRQIASLMRMKAATGFTGRAGGGELGESWYINELPTVIQKYADNYRMVRI